MSEKSGQDKVEQKATTKQADRQTGTPEEAKPSNKPAAKRSGTGTRRDAKSSSAKSTPKRGGAGSRQVAKSAEKPTPKRGGGGALFLSFFALLGAAGAGVGGWYLWQQQQETAARVAATESRLQDSITELRADIDSRLQRQTDDLSQALSKRDRQLDVRTRELQQAIVDVRSRLGQDRTGWAVAEVEHLLRIANHRLRLARDVQSAKVALKEADQRLIALADPAFLSVREAISKELQALRNVGGADRENAAMRLTGLIETVESLPVAGPYQAEGSVTPGQQEPSQAPESVSNWEEFLEAVWADIRSLVTIRRHEEDGARIPLLAPQERYFLHQNLRLKLETARLALLEGNPETYQSTLAEAEQWLSSYFAEEAAATRGALETLKEVQGVKVSPELPEISESLRVLNRIRGHLSEEEGQIASEQAPAVTGESQSGDQPEAKP